MLELGRQVIGRNDLYFVEKVLPLARRPAAVAQLDVVEPARVYAHVHAHDPREAAAAARRGELLPLDAAQLRKHLGVHAVPQRARRRAVALGQRGAVGRLGQLAPGDAEDWKFMVSSLLLLYLLARL